jgi:hypothetical protein
MARLTALEGAEVYRLRVTTKNFWLDHHLRREHPRLDRQ